MPTVTIDGKCISAPEGATILSAARLLGIALPALCFDERIEPPCSCLVCSVKVEGRSGLVPSCVAPVTDGMVVNTSGAETVAARKQAIELLLTEHAGDCEAPCTGICPCGTDIPRMAYCIAQGKYREALACVRETMALPGILGYICHAPCEKGCRRGHLDGAIGIRALHLTLAAAQGAAAGRPLSDATPATGKKVACIGAGPAGLSASYYLACSGHAVTLFDNHEKPGGTLAFGVLPGVLPPAVLDADIGTVLGAGITLRCNTEVGRDLSIAALLEEFDAVVLAVGSGARRQEQQGSIVIGAETFTIDTPSLTTDLQGVFACGALVTPGKMAARAAGQGRRVAVAVDRYLRGCGDTPETDLKTFKASAGKLSVDELNSLAATDIAATTTLTNASGTPYGAAVADAARCFRCDCGTKDTCRLRLLAAEMGIYRQPHRTGIRRTIERRIFKSGLVYEPGKCTLCGRCVALASEIKPGISFTGRGFDVRVEAPFGAGLDLAMGSLLSTCVGACPTGALRIRQEPGYE